jgi:hypothetical protein
VFAFTHARLLCSRAGKIQLNPFVHESLISLHERLAFRIVKEQPRYVLAKRQTQAAHLGRLAFGVSDEGVVSGLASGLTLDRSTNWWS